MAERYEPGDRVDYRGQPATVLHASLSRVFIELDRREQDPNQSWRLRTRISVRTASLTRLEDESMSAEGHA